MLPRLYISWNHSLPESGVKRRLATVGERQDTIDKGLEAALKAVKLDDCSAFTHTGLGNRLDPMGRTETASCTNAVGQMKGPDR